MFETVGGTVRMGAAVGATVLAISGVAYACGSGGGEGPRSCDRGGASYDQRACASGVDAYAVLDRDRDGHGSWGRGDGRGDDRGSKGDDHGWRGDEGKGKDHPDGDKGGDSTPKGDETTPKVDDPAPKVEPTTPAPAPTPTATPTETVTTPTATATSAEPASQPAPEAAPAEQPAPVAAPTPLASKPVVKGAVAHGAVERPAARKAVRKVVAKAVRKVVKKTAATPSARKPVRVVVQTAPCARLTISRKTLPAGAATTLRLAAQAGGKRVAGASVVLEGPGVRRVVALGATGRTEVTVTAPRVGVLTATLRETKQCGASRVGVVGEVEPTVTG